MEDLFEVRFASNENDFIYNAMENNGHVQIPTKVVKCLFLSDRARTLYTSLRGFAYGNKRKCYPSQTTLKLELNWSNTKLGKALKELRLTGMVSTEERSGYPLVYILEEIQNIPVIIHSEMVYMIKAKNDWLLNRFFHAFREYKKTNLCIKVSSSKSPISYMSEVEEWFHRKMEELDPGFVQLEVEVEDGHFEVKEVVEERPVPARRLPSIVKEQVEKTADDPLNEEKPKKAKKSKDFREVEVNDWTTHHFRSYFDHLYLQKYNLPYPSKPADLGAIKTLKELKGNNEVVKQQMEVYFNQDEFNQYPRSVFNFVSANVQTKLDHFLKYGSFAKKYEKKPVVKPLGSEEEWLRDNGF